MTKTKRKFLVRRLAASVLVAVLIGVGLDRAFAGGSAPPPPDRAATFVPADALIYLNLGTDSGKPRWQHTAAAIAKLPLAGQLRDALFTSATSSALGNLTLSRDVRPWLGNEAAFAELPGRGQRLLLFRVGKPALARGAFNRAAGATPPQTYGGVLLRQVGGGSVAGLSGSWAFIGAPGAVHAALDLRGRPASSLAGDRTYADLSNGLPHDRVGNAWLSGAWLRVHAATPTSILAGAARVAGIGSAAVGFGDDGKLMRLAVRGRVLPGAAGPSGCTGGRGENSSLLSKAPAQPALFLGLAGARCVLQDLMASPGSAIGKALRSFSTQARRVGVSMEREVLPLLSGQSALSLTPGPTITLEAAGVPSQTGLNVLGRLQPALISLLNPQGSGDTPGFAAQTVNGITALSANLSPAFQLSYAAFGGDLVVSNSLSGVAAAAKGRHLAETKDFKLVLGNRPKRPSALVFFDLEKLLALADQAGLGSNPTYAAVRDDLAKIGAAGGVLSREGNDIDAELRLKNP